MAVAVVAVITLTQPRGTGRDAAATTRVTTTAAPSTSATPSPTGSVPTGSGGMSLGSTSASGSASAGRLPLVVLNNTETAGLATAAAKTFRAGGWTVATVGNLQNDILSTCAYYDPDVSGAKSAAEALRSQFPAIRRVEAKFDQLPKGPVVVVLTPDYATG